MSIWILFAKLIFAVRSVIGKQLRVNYYYYYFSVRWKALRTNCRSEWFKLAANIQKLQTSGQAGSCLGVWILFRDWTKIRRKSCWEEICVRETITSLCCVSISCLAFSLSLFPPINYCCFIAEKFFRLTKSKCVRECTVCVHTKWSVKSTPTIVHAYVVRFMPTNRPTAHHE